MLFYFIFKLKIILEIWTIQPNIKIIHYKQPIQSSDLLKSYSVFLFVFASMNRFFLPFNETNHLNEAIH